MKNEPLEAKIPTDCRAQELIQGADFCDAWSIESSAIERSAMAHFLEAAKQTPRWVNACMTLRNRVGSIVGLKNLGTLSNDELEKSADKYQVGERVGIFTVFENHFDEALIGDKDKHLNVVLSIHRGPVQNNGKVLITVTTIVHIKNLLGKIYMIPVKPMHRIIAPAVLRGVASAEV